MVCVDICARECRCSWGPGGSIGSHDSETPHHAQVLWIEQEVLLTIEFSLQPLNDWFRSVF